MGFWDRKINGPLDEMFDLNRDGMLSPGEVAFKYDFLNSFHDNNKDNDNFDDDFEDRDFDGGECDGWLYD